MQAEICCVVHVLKVPLLWETPSSISFMSMQEALLKMVNNVRHMYIR